MPMTPDELLMTYMDQTETVLEDDEMTATYPIAPAEQIYAEEYSGPDLVRSLLSLDRPDQSSVDILLGTADVQDQGIESSYFTEGPTGLPLDETSAQYFMRGSAELKQQVEEGRYPGSKVSDSMNAEGRREIKIIGSSDEFQGLGKYATPEDFMRQNPEGFKKVNPILAARMQAEAVARAEAPTRMAVQIASEMENKMKLITEEKDPVKKQLMLEELKASSAAAAANMTREMRIMAEQKAGVKKYDELIRNNAALDAQDPIWSQKGIPSPNTQKLIREREAAIKSVGTLTKQMIAENPTLAILSQKLKGFVSVQEKLLGKELDRADKRDDQVRTVADMLTPEGVKFISYLYPEVGGNEEKAADRALNLLKNPATKKEWAAVLDPGFETSMLVPMAMAGSKLAQTLTVKTQMELTGMDKDSVMKDVNRFYTIASNEEAFFKALNSSPDKKAKTGITMRYASASDKEQAQIRQGYALQYSKEFKTNEMLGNVESWQGNFRLTTDPEAVKSMDKLKTVNGGKPISLMDFMNDYLDVPKAQRAARFSTIQNAMTSAADVYSKSMFGSVDRIRLNQTLNSYNGVTSVSRMLGDAWNSGVFSDTNLNNPLLAGVK